MSGSPLRLLADLQSTQSRETAIRGLGRFSLNVARAIHALGPGVVELSGAFTPFLPHYHVIDELPGIGVPAMEGWVKASRWSEEVMLENGEHYDRATREFDARLYMTPVDGYPNPFAALPSLSARRSTPPIESAILYDLIPYLFPSTYLREPEHRRSYELRLDAIRHLDVIFTISDSASSDAEGMLDIPRKRMVNIGAGVSSAFRPLRALEREFARERLRELGVDRRFVLCVSPTEARKNLVSLLRAWSALPARVRSQHQLVILGLLQEYQLGQLRSYAGRLGLDAGEVLFVSNATDSDMIAFYNLATVSVLPSLYEGFGLPIVESIRCGTPALASNVSSMPELLVHDDYLFDPRDPLSISARIEEAVEDEEWRSRALVTQRALAVPYTWERVASRIVETLVSMREGEGAQSTVVGSDLVSSPIDVVVGTTVEGTEPFRTHRLIDALKARADVVVMQPGGGGSEAVSERTTRVFMLGNSWKEARPVIRSLLSDTSGTAVLDLHDVGVSRVLREALEEESPEQLAETLPKEIVDGAQRLLSSGHDVFEVADLLAADLLTLLVTRAATVIVHEEETALLVERSAVPDRSVEMVPWGMDPPERCDPIDSRTARTRLYGTDRLVVLLVSLGDASATELRDVLGAAQSLGLGSSLLVVTVASCADTHAVADAIEWQGLASGVDVRVWQGADDGVRRSLMAGCTVAVRFGEGDEAFANLAQRLGRPLVTLRPRSRSGEPAHRGTFERIESEIRRALMAGAPGGDPVPTGASSPPYLSWQTVRDRYIEVLARPHAGKSS